MVWLTAGRLGWVTQGDEDSAVGGVAVEVRVVPEGSDGTAGRWG